MESILESPNARRKLLFLYESLSAPKVHWTHKGETEWFGEFNVGKAKYFVNFYVYSGKWDLTFSRDLYSEWRDALGFHEMVQVFLGVEQAILDFFEGNPEVEVVEVLPAALEGKRRSTISGRKKGSASSIFDANKYNAYLFLFSHSKLKDLGYRIHEKGDKRTLIITAPKKDAGSFEKEVDRLAAQEVSAS